MNLLRTPWCFTGRLRQHNLCFRTVAAISSLRLKHGPSQTKGHWEMVEASFKLATVPNTPLRWLQGDDTANQILYRTALESFSQEIGFGILGECAWKDESGASIVIAMLQPEQYKVDKH
ncbi:hypothetical protein A6R68_13625, partial [Neotoma lepida]